MTLTIRPATAADVDAMAKLLLADAENRCVAHPGLWRMDAAAQDRTRNAIIAALEDNAPGIRQRWLVAYEGPVLAGVTHAALLPVPPIYSGDFGPPGFVMEDCAVTPDASDVTRQAMLRAAEDDLIETGASIILASSVVGGDWETCCQAGGYAPLTLYLSKTGLTTASKNGVDPATARDIPGIVTSSALNRAILEALDPFWKVHPEADQRFGAWMTRSLTLEDRDMFISRSGGSVSGYAISQPATRMHFPVPHDISGVGVIDDFFHSSMENPQQLAGDIKAASALLSAAEAARARRGDHSVFVVCPAAWQSKIDLLEQAGYRTAQIWYMKTVDRWLGNSDAT